MEKFLQNIGVGLRSIDDPFFEDSYRICKIFQRKGVTVEDDEELCHDIIKEFSCYITGCKATFNKLIDFEMHYNSNHRYVCAECNKCLPNPRFLDIHIQETHDSFFQVLSTKQPMYQCYVSECDLKFNTSFERRDHCVSVHKYPKNFRFDNTPHCVRDKSKDKMDIDEPEPKRKESKSRKIQLNKNQKSKMFIATAKTTTSTNVIICESQLNASNNNAGATSLLFVPRQVHKSYTKILTKNQSGEKDVLETGCMMDLANTLPNT
ncbi:zinc finger protein 511 lethal (2) k10201 [Bombus vancouverensis nearcticus]|uniref:zinc finger protein 511 lethal (2) k10201 n=1 Tax=Bombus vancouverensis nearcticus TaxID=2705178 RepID=UPI00143A9DC1|nr:zinc finger protein 511 [Bombus vancouverensis nearcticus]